MTKSDHPAITVTTTAAVALVDTIYADAARIEAETAPRTPEQMRWARGVAAHLRERIAERRRARLDAEPAPARPHPIAAALRALGRGELLARIAALASAGQLQLAHRNLKVLSDDDLRRILQLALGDPAP